VVCHCTNCQEFARYCEAEDRILDRNAGTDLYQSRCAHVDIHIGRDHLACIHLTEKPTLRWFAACCRTPMFNSYANGKIPYITTLVPNCDGARRDRVLGEPLGHLFLDDAPCAESGLRRMSIGRLMRRFFVRMVKDLLSGDRRRNPLFDPDTLLPIAEPHRLSADERRALKHTG